MKKYFLTTALMGTFIAPAFGADKIITSANTCTVDVLGVSDNNATANTIATWTLNEYECPAGQYLVEYTDEIQCDPCPAGLYCPGGKYTVESENRGSNACPMGYSNSSVGAKSETQCYTACTVANANIVHATAVGGNDYYGSGVDACYATECEKGYHVDGDIKVLEKAPLIPLDYKSEMIEYQYITITGNSGRSIRQEEPVDLTERNTWQQSFDSGIVYGHGSCQPKLHDPALEYLYENVEAIFSGSISMEELQTNLEARVGKYKAQVLVEGLSGGGEISNIDAALFYMDANANYDPNSVGRYCYCQMTGFMSTVGEKENITGAPWVFFGSPLYSVEECADNCAQDCGSDVSTALLAAKFGALEVVNGGICAANTINIDWNPDNGGDHIKNMCTYEGSITLPTPDPVKPGYTFTGWKLVE